MVCIISSGILQAKLPNLPYAKLMGFANVLNFGLNTSQTKPSHLWPIVEKIRSVHRFLDLGYALGELGAIGILLERRFKVLSMLKEGLWTRLIPLQIGEFAILILLPMALFYVEDKINEYYAPNYKADTLITHNPDGRVSATWDRRPEHTSQQRIWIFRIINNVALLALSTTPLFYATNLAFLTYNLWTLSSWQWISITRTFEDGVDVNVPAQGVNVQTVNVTFTHRLFQNHLNANCNRCGEGVQKEKEGQQIPDLLLCNEGHPLHRRCFTELVVNKSQRALDKIQYEPDFQYRDSNGNRCIDYYVSLPKSIMPECETCHEGYRVGFRMNIETENHRSTTYVDLV